MDRSSSGVFTFDLKITKTLAAQYADYKGFTTEEQLIPISVRVAGFQAVTWIDKDPAYAAPRTLTTVLHSTAFTGSSPEELNANKTIRNFWIDTADMSSQTGEAPQIIDGNDRIRTLLLS